MVRPDKVVGVKSLANSARDITTVILTEYRGLNVKQMEELCLALGGEICYAVAKNKLSKLTFEEAGMESLDEYLVDPTMIIFVGHDGDPIAATKVTSKFARGNPAFVVKDGLMDGNVMDAEDVKKPTSLESRKVLLMKPAGVLRTLTYRVAAVMVAPASKTVCTADALHEKQVKAT